MVKRRLPRWPRLALQLGFLALTLIAVFVVRGNAEAWCPFGGVEAIYGFFHEGNLPCSLAVTNFYILGAILLLALVMRRGFCGYMCPIGTISEWTRRGAARIGIRVPEIPYRVDRRLSLLMYPFTALILFLTYRAGELVFRGFDPCYALLSRHGEDITFWTYVSAGVVLAGSAVVMLPFCRWLCPLAAVLNPFSRAGIMRVRRHESACIDCGRCARDCPMRIPVDQRMQVTEARCTSCLECIRSCPVDSALDWAPPGKASRRWPQWSIVAIVLASVGLAVAVGELFPMASYTWERGRLPEPAAITEFRIEELDCKGRATLLVRFLIRQDELEVDGPLRLEAWPSPATGRVRVSFDPALSDSLRIFQALTEPYYDVADDRWRLSPFRIEGYEPF